MIGLANRGDIIGAQGSLGTLVRYLSPSEGSNSAHVEMINEVSLSTSPPSPTNTYSKDQTNVHLTATLKPVLRNVHLLVKIVMVPNNTLLSYYSYWS